METVAVLDYGMSNLRSVAKALEHVCEGNRRVLVCTTPEELLQADRVVFPGQGAIGDCMRNLKERGLDEALRECMKTKPYLGLCLGLQSLMQESDEDGGTAGLGWLQGNVVRFRGDMHEPGTGARLKIPHMGWNEVLPAREHSLWSGIPEDSRFYFVHSYYVRPADRAVIAATTHYGVEFVSAVAKDNVFAVQFHPEKSQRAGLQLLGNFLTWDGLSP